MSVASPTNPFDIVRSIKAVDEKSKLPSIDLESPTGSLRMHFAGVGK